MTSMGIATAMRYINGLFITGSILVAAGCSADTGNAGAEAKHQQLREMIEQEREPRYQRPGGKLDRVWADCLDQLETLESPAPARATCHVLEGQGVSSEIVALALDGDFVPVIESRIPDLAIEGRIVVDVVGGPGDNPFYSNPPVTKELVEQFRGNKTIRLDGGLMEETPQYELMSRGFTVASIAYWGTSVRTLDEPDEIGSAIREVGSVIDYYRDQLDREPPLITGSLGNHLVLGALGKERVEAMQVLSLVPIMDGLQRHLVRVMADEAWTEPDVLKGQWVWRNIYRREGDRTAFDHRRVIDQREFVPQYIGDADYPWRELKLRGACSTIVLGEKDPRTRDYLADRKSLPSNLQVWDTGHSIFQEAPEQARALFAKFADCLSRKPAPTD